MIRAKFTCTSVEKQKGWGGHDFLYSAKFQPVTQQGVPENAEFWAATPAGSIVLTSILPDAFEVGVEYYVDFTAAPPVEATH